MHERRLKLRAAPFFTRLMNEPSGNLYEVVFERLVYGGDALGRLPDGRAVFAPFVLPGERARVRLVEEKKRFARGQVVELLEASPERIKPRSRAFHRLRGLPLPAYGV